MMVEFIQDIVTIHRPRIARKSPVDDEKQQSKVEQNGMAIINHTYLVVQCGRYTSLVTVVYERKEDVDRPLL